MAKTIELDLNQIERLSAQGLTEQQISDALGISNRTLERRKRDNVEFVEAIKRGKAKGVATVTNSLFEQAKTGNTTACIFFLKNRAGWADKQENVLTGADGGPIEVKAIEHRIVKA